MSFDLRKEYGYVSRTAGEVPPILPGAWFDG
jgi:hypothetical protein